MYATLSLHIDPLSEASFRMDCQVLHEKRWMDVPWPQLSQVALLGPGIEQTY